MPMYSFSCPDCGRRFEELLSVKRKDDAVCPACGAKAERVWNGKCYFGAKRASSGGDCECGADCPSGGRGGCSGNCAGCAGCGG